MIKSISLQLEWPHFGPIYQEESEPLTKKYLFKNQITQEKATLKHDIEDANVIFVLHIWELYFSMVLLQLI
jgi:hypothetical protein